MSNLIVRILCKNYEDFEPYLHRSCALKHWPEMWDGERQAERGIYEERMRMKEKIYFLARDRERRTIQHFKNLKRSKDYMWRIKNRALLDLIAPLGWLVKNEDAIRFFRVSPIYATVFDEELAEREKSKPKPQPIKPKEYAKWEVKVLKGMQDLWQDVCTVKLKDFGNRKEIQAYVLNELARENKYKKTNPNTARSSVSKRVYKIV